MRMTLDLAQNLKSLPFQLGGNNRSRGGGGGHLVRKWAGESQTGVEKRRIEIEHEQERRR